MARTSPQIDRNQDRQDDSSTPRESAQAQQADSSTEEAQHPHIDVCSPQETLTKSAQGFETETEESTKLEPRKRDRADTDSESETPAKKLRQDTSDSAEERPVILDVDTVQQHLSSFRQSYVLLTNENTRLKVEMEEQHQSLVRQDKTILELMTAEKEQHQSLVRQDKTILELMTVEKEQRETLKARDRSTLHNKILNLEADKRDLRIEIAATLEAAHPSLGEENNVPDKYVTGEWKRLVNSIRECVNQFITRRPKTASHLDKNCNAEVPRGLVKRFKECPELSSFHLQASVWKRIYFDIFQGQQSHWGGELGRRLVIMCCNLADLNDVEQREALIKIKAQTATELHQKHGISNESIERLTKSLTLDLSIFIRPENKRAFEMEIRDIIHRAAKLLAIFMTSKALYIVRGLYEDPATSKRFLINPNRATVCFSLTEDLESEESESDESGSDESESAKSRRVLGFCISPTLEKFGIASGGRFDMSKLLCKGQVTAK